MTTCTMYHLYYYIIYLSNSKIFIVVTALYILSLAYIYIMIYDYVIQYYINLMFAELLLFYIKIILETA